MKLLTLIRHAKSSWDGPGLPDHDRPLNKRGEKAAPRIGKVLAGRGISPDAIISSTALRAVTTAEIIAGNLGYDVKTIICTPEIYAASSVTLLRFVNGIEDRFTDAILVGHNPGFEDLAHALLGNPSEVDRMPTCAVVRMRFDAGHWAEIAEGTGELVEFLYPKMLE